MHPYPLEDGAFDQILMQDVIEHVREPYDLMRELHRIGRPGARVHLRTPHFSSVLAYSDPTHRHAFSAAAIRALAEPGFAHYTAARFRVVHVTLDLWAPFRAIGIGALRQPPHRRLREVPGVPLPRDEHPGGAGGAQVTRPLRVGLNAIFLEPGMGGLGTYVLELVPALLRAAPELRLTVLANERGRGLLAAQEWAGEVRDRRAAR